MSVRMYTNKYGVLYLDIRHGQGERSRKSTDLRDTPKNRKLVDEHVIPKLQLQILNGEYFSTSSQDVASKTLEEFGYKSLRRHANKRREHVQKTYLQHFESKIVPHFGDRMVSHISSNDLIDWQNVMLNDFKASSVKKFRTIFNGIMEDARRELINGKKMIEQNPFRDVCVPKNREIFDEWNEESALEECKINPFTIEEIDDLLARSQGQLRNFIGIMSRTGMRPGELLALRWQDVSLHDETIRIRKTRILGKNGPTKKKASNRDIEMLPGVKDFFLNQHDLIGGSPMDDVFLNSSKKQFYSHDIIAVRFKRLLSKNDKRYLYQLRHSFASMMIANGEDILWVSRMLGHKSSDITLKTYAKAYKVTEDKSQRQKRAQFLEKGHSMGTVNNIAYEKTHEIGS